MQRSLTPLLLSLVLIQTAQATEIKLRVGTNLYSEFSTSLTNGAFVFIDSDPNSPTPIRPTQRSLGYREVTYKSLVADRTAFKTVTPVTEGSTMIFDYSDQAGATNLVGFWSIKNPGIMIGPDGLAYITDAHHTVAGYLQSSTHPIMIPGQRRTILGHIAANFYKAAGPRPVEDSWWYARLPENNALINGPNGNQLAVPTDPGFRELQRLRPSAHPMPLTPASLGPQAMLHDHFRSLAWGMVDGIAVSATDPAGTKIVGFKKYPPSGGAEINFVEFLWADFLRNRIVWDDSKSGSPLKSSEADANAIQAPIAFFTAVANGIGLAKSESYRDQFGRGLIDYSQPRFGPNITNWAIASIANGLAKRTDTYNFYIRDDSWINGPITPSKLSTNILHIDTVTGVTLPQAMNNLETMLVNAGGSLKTSWRDAVVPNSVMTFESGSGPVTLSGSAFVRENTVLSNGLLTVNGILTNRQLTIAQGTLAGNGTIEGATVILPGGTLAPGRTESLTIKGPLTLSGKTIMLIRKTGTTLRSDSVQGITTLDSGGALVVRASGDPLAIGDSFQLFSADIHKHNFENYELPPLPADMVWDTSRLTVEGKIAVKNP